VVTLKEALTMNEAQLSELKAELKEKIEAKKDINAYIGLEESGNGVPILVKDNIQVTGWNVSGGSKILQHYIAPYDATVVKNMRERGISPFGRANMDEFAMGSSTETSFYGRTLNPHDSSRVPGGSSGGSAAAVGAGIAIAALGSDTGGSIRQPAAFCGIVGMKPTYGRVSRYGLSAYGSSLDQIGPMTQNVEDAAILYDIISGYDEKDSTSADISYEKVSQNLNPNRKLKIAVIDNYIDGADDAVVDAYKNAMKILEDEGHTIVHKSLMDAKYDVSAYYITSTAEATTNLARYDGVRYGNRVAGTDLKDMYVRTRSEGFGDEVKRRILLGNFVLSSGYYDAYYVKAQKSRQLIKNEYDKIFAEVDLVLSPVTPTAAFKFGSKKDPLQMYLSDIYTISVNLAGLPAISVPCGDDNGLPIGLQFIAKAYDEQTLFDGALSLERALK